jgi:2,3-bisphosphoglycerate-dependent phosphoglycerate mutase
VGTLVLLRHGESRWNAENRFTGWWDVDLTALGEDQARAAGTLMAEAELGLDVVHTSVQTRAIRTANLALDEMGLSWLPVRRHWRLNERHYGDLTGRGKAETTARYGEEQVFIWRRSYDVPPPPTAPDNAFDANSDRRYRGLDPAVLPVSECLADVVERMMPYWYDAIVADLAAGQAVLVVAHGNSLRALVKHLDGIADDAIAQLNIPTGVPLVYELGDDFMPVDRRPPLERSLGDPAAVAAAAEAVAKQATGEVPA